MKIARIVHQQIFQLRWQLLACIGLIMVMPLEETAVNVADGSGFSLEAMIAISLILAPFLAGLIACANVQADLNDKRVIFWMSKPTRITSFITIKYITGLVLALFVLACPIIFDLAGYLIYKTNNRFLKGADGIVILLVTVMVTVLAYTICFLCNVIIRKTARAWLVGMTTTAFLLLIPFILPLMNFRDIVSDLHNLASNIYVTVLLATVLTTFMVSILAVKRNWHLQTNLKGLFWTGAAIVFIFMMVFSRQVANIKILDEIETGMPSYSRFQNFDDRIVLGSSHVQFKDKYVNIKDSHIEFESMDPPPAMPEWLKNMTPLYEVDKELHCGRYPGNREIIYKTGDDTYFFQLNNYYRKIKTGKSSHENHCEKIYLCSYKLVDNYYPMPIAALDLSDFTHERYNLAQSMRLVDDKLVVFSNMSFAVVKIKDNGEFELLDKKIDALRPFSMYMARDRKMFKIPRVLATDLSIEDQIKLSIDRVNSWDDNFHKYSVIDVHDGQISFSHITDFDIARYDVVKSDDEFVYCKFKDARPFTLLENMFGDFHVGYEEFIKDGKLYLRGEHKLSVFDIRSNRIRKLGHFERISDNFQINYIKVLDDGNILMSAQTEKRRASTGLNSWIVKNNLYLLKNPE
jgi:hypothetical protein